MSSRERLRVLREGLRYKFRPKEYERKNDLPKCVPYKVE